MLLGLATFDSNSTSAKPHQARLSLLWLARRDSSADLLAMSNPHRKSHRHLGNHFLDRAETTAPHMPKIFTYWLGPLEDSVKKVKRGGCQDLRRRFSNQIVKKLPVKNTIAPTLENMRLFQQQPHRKSQLFLRRVIFLFKNG